MRGGELAVRVTRAELDALIVAAAGAPGRDRRSDRELATLVRYLETLEERFADADDASPLDNANEPDGSR